MSRSVHEVKARCSLILKDEQIIFLVGASSSPSAAFDMVLAETNDSDKAKAGRWLAVLRRDFPEEYVKLLPVKPSHVTSDKAQAEREV